MEEEKRIHLTSGEISSLWTTYMNDSMSMCILKFMLKHIKDPEIKPIIEYALESSTKHVNQLKDLFKKEGFAIPKAFSDEDVNMSAPWLFSDVFSLTFLNHMSSVGMLAYSGFISMSARSDVREFFTDCKHESTTLYHKSTDVALEKGVNARFPYITLPKETDYIDSKDYYGLNPFDEKRPLNAAEISHLYMNTMTNSFGTKLCYAFAQTSPTVEVQEYLMRLKDVAMKHTQIFTKSLMKEGIETPKLPDVAVSDSTTQTFSDKLIMFIMSLLISSGIGNYATAAAASPRLDLAVNYERLSLEVARLAKTGTDIMIKHNWLEQPPGIKKREHLVKYKNNR
ncbi:DUF3231 family protein [Ornithinibacillus halophilus]|uniref:DUF3231 family protein n=1 Tax=Ornithinibacillus halophilus TaxID=930117 RepID=A0A1M5L5D7_9BACI|nr:DUF3231 family protein [Ornithinibacillus halophilus]SHG60155.1 Protein of unknown function [Ornithinibacillus halophilus]